METDTYQIDRQTYGNRHIPTYRQTDRQMETDTYPQTDRQIPTDRQRQMEARIKTLITFYKDIENKSICRRKILYRN